MEMGGVVWVSHTRESIFLTKTPELNTPGVFLNSSRTRALVWEMRFVWLCLVGLSQTQVLGLFCGGAIRKF
jgi:hypothetical protein